MKLRSRVFFILAGMWIFISLVLYIDSRLTLENNYKKIEKTEAIMNVQRAQKAFDNMLYSLQMLNTDWAQWDDAWHFMQDKNQKFVMTNMAFTTFSNAKINLILFFDASGKLFSGKNYDLLANKFVPIPESLLSYLSARPALTKMNSMQSGKAGIISLPDGAVLMSILPVLTSQGKGPANGALMMGYFLNNEHLKKLSQTLDMNLYFYLLPFKSKNELLNVAYNSLINGEKYFIEPSGKKIIYGFTLINDVDGHPAAMLGVSMPRTLYAEGLMTIQHYLIIVIGIGVIVLISMMYLLKIFVLDRVLSVSRQVISINSESSFSQRIKMGGKDELEEMVVALNSLMEIIELTQEQLKYRIQQRTEKLERLSDLNKNLFTEMNRQKAVEVQLRKDEKLLKQMAYYDVLTGLPNRIFFHELLRNEIAKTRDNDTSIAVLFLDVDKFKSINDQYGHEIGDKFLKHTAQLLKNRMRDSDVVARLSGDEFILFLTHVTDRMTIDWVAEDILKNIYIPLKIDGIEITSTFSIGISIYPADGLTIEELERNADLAMYYAKKQDGNAYYYFDAIKQDKINI